MKVEKYCIDPKEGNPSQTRVEIQEAGTRADELWRDGKEGPDVTEEPNFNNRC